MSTMNIKAPLLVSVGEAAAMLSVSRHSIYNWVYGGRIKSLKVGDRRVIAYQEILKIAENGLDREPE